MKIEREVLVKVQYLRVSKPEAEKVLDNLRSHVPLLQKLELPRPQGRHRSQRSSGGAAVGDTSSPLSAGRHTVFVVVFVVAAVIVNIIICVTGKVNSNS